MFACLRELTLSCVLTNLLGPSYCGGKLESSPYWKNLVPVTFTSIIATLGATSTAPRLDCHDLKANNNGAWCNLHCPALKGS